MIPIHDLKVIFTIALIVAYIKNIIELRPNAFCIAFVGAICYYILVLIWQPHHF